MKCLILCQGKYRNILFLALVSVLYFIGIAYARQEGEVDGSIHAKIKHAETYYWLGMQDNGDLQSFEHGLTYLEESEKELQTQPIPETEKEAIEKEIANLRGDLEFQKEIFHKRFSGLFPLVRLLKPTIFADEAVLGSFVLADKPEAVAIRQSVHSLCKEIIGYWYTYPQFNVVFTSVPHNQEFENEALFVMNTYDRFYVQNLKATSSMLSGREIDQFQQGTISEESLRKLCTGFGVPYILAVLVRDIDEVDGIRFIQAEGHLYSTETNKIEHAIFKFSLTRDRRDEFIPVVILNIVFLLLSFLLFVVFIKKEGHHVVGWLTITAIPIAGFLVGRLLPWFIIPTVSAFAPESEAMWIVSFWWPIFIGGALFVGPGLFYKLIAARVVKFFPLLRIDGKGGIIFCIIGLGISAYLTGPFLVYGGSNPYANIVLISVSAGFIGLVVGKCLDNADPLPIARIPFAFIASFFLGYALCSAELQLIIVASGSSIMICMFLLAFNPRRIQTSEQTHPFLLHHSHIRDTKSFVEKLKNDEKYIYIHLKNRLSPVTQKYLKEHDYNSNNLIESVVKDFNHLIRGHVLLPPKVRGDIKLSERSQNLISENPRGDALIELNSLLLRDVFPEIEMKRIQSGVPMNEAGLLDFAQNPPFYPPPIFKNIVEKVNSGSRNRQSTMVVLVGDSGVGKTTIAQEIAQSVTFENKARNIETVILFGECPEPARGESDKSTAYLPFRKILSEQFGIDLLGSAREEMKQIDTVLEGLFESVVPFSGILFPSESDSLATANSRTEISTSVVKMIRKFTEKKHVILFLDDIQWIDEASCELLHSIVQHFPQGDACPFTVLLTSRKDIVKDFPEIHDSFVLLPHYTVPERVELLQKVLGLSEETAQKVVDKIGSTTSQKGELFWLFQVVTHLARSGAFIKKPNGFHFTPRYEKMDSLPIPNELEDILAEQLRKFPQYRPLLECAACASIGVEFRADFVGDALGISRMEVYRGFLQCEEETDIVNDVRRGDAIFSFKSSFMLSVIRKYLHVTGSGPSTNDVPQLIREYHAQLAIVLESTLKSSSYFLFDVAKHYYAAGSMHVLKAIRFCVEAAHAASSNYNHDQAREFLMMAKECAKYGKNPDELEEEFLIIELDESHSEGRFLTESAQRGLEFIRTSNNVSVKVLLTVARACYDAGSSLIEVDRISADKLFKDCVDVSRKVLEVVADEADRAEAYHFIGIALPMVVNQVKNLEREANLRTGLKILQNVSNDNRIAQLLRCRILNSLAGEVSRSNAEEARELYLERLELNEKLSLGDLPGMARTYGGLGRLEYFKASPSIDNALEYFRKDLEISQRIGDIRGQVEMNSLIGSCYIRQGNFDQAVDYFQYSYDLAQSAKDKYYAGVGLLRLHIGKHQLEEATVIGKELFELVKSGKKIPLDCRDDLLSSLETAKKDFSGDWIQAFIESIMS